MVEKKKTCKNLNKVINLMNDIIVVFNEDKKIVDANTVALRTLGYTIEEIKDKKITFIINPGLRENLIKLTEDVETEDEELLTTQLLTKTGYFIRVNIMIQQLCDTDHNIAVFKIEKTDSSIEQWFSQYIKNNHSAVYLTELSTGKIVNINDYTSDLLGYSREEIIGKTMVELGVIDFEERNRNISILNSGQELKNKYIKLRAKSGKQKSIVFSSKIVYSDDNQYVIVRFSDITEIDELRIKSEQSETFLRMLFDTVNSAIIVYDVINEGKTGYDYLIKDMNKTAMQYENLTIEEARGNPIKKYRNNVEEFGIIEVFKRVWETGQSEYFPAKVYEENGVATWFENRVFKLKTGEIIAVYDDVSTQKRLEEDLFAEKEQLSITLQSIGDGVIATDTEEKVTMMNTMAEHMTGWKQKEAIGKHISQIFDIYNEYTGYPIASPVKEVLASGNIMALANHTALRNKDGNVRLIADSAAPIMDANGNIAGTVLVFRDVTEEKRRNEQIIHMSQHDALTGLYNRLYFEESLKRFAKEKRYPISLIMGDLNGLKITNDVFGHDVGDELLVQIADVLRGHARECDVLARWGGDEYVMLMPDTDLETAREINRSIYKTCGKYEKTNSSEVTPLSISLGYATHEDNSKDIMSLVKEAEDFMYKGKLLESRSTHSNIIASIKKTLFEKSHETEEHANRLKTMCAKIGTQMGLADQQINDLELLAVLHDIGKITIDDAILTKRGKLSPEEWQIMERHPATGYRIIQSAPELSHIAEFILAHHEKWDGTGYPHGIEGKAIPVLARILSVVDAYDAIVSDKPYGQARSKQEAIEEIKSQSGKQFDPEIVDVFIKIADRL